MGRNKKPLAMIECPDCGMMMAARGEQNLAARLVGHVLVKHGYVIEMEEARARAREIIGPEKGPAPKEKHYAEKRKAKDGNPWRDERRRRRDDQLEFILG